jgi:parvulin-like peptidyl-prolyl isomerase
MIAKRSYFSIFILLFTVQMAFPQKSIDQKIVDDFKTASKDSIFVTRNSDLPYRLETFDFVYDKDTAGNKFYRDLLLGKIGQVYGPYNTDISVFYIKIIDADTSYKVRVGNIWIDINKGREIAFEQANRILTEVKGGKDYNLYCILYSDDKNKKKDCDLGWVYNKIMLEPFATEITKHGRNEVYLVETSYGFHIVKSLADPYRERQIVRYVSLTKKK